MCRELDLFSATLIAIGSRKFKAVSSGDSIFTGNSVERRRKTQAYIGRRLVKLDVVDREEPEIRKVTVEAHADKQISLTDPDPRSMMKAGGGSVKRYNVQTAVDSTHHLSAAHEVTDSPSDRGQLSSMALRAKAALASDSLEPEAEDTQALAVVVNPG